MPKHGALERLILKNIFQKKWVPAGDLLIFFCNWSSVLGMQKHKIEMLLQVTDFFVIIFNRRRFKED